MNKCGPFLISSAVSALFVVAAMAETAEFNARGNEPGWSLHLTDEGITFRTMSGKSETISPLPAVQEADGAKRYQAKVDDTSFDLAIFDEICADTMTGMPYPASVTVEIGAEKFSGCGGVPTTLLLGEWTADKIDGKTTIEKSQASLSFGVDGRLAGNGSCNRYLGSFYITGEGLVISEVGSSMMMCEDLLMEQEANFLGILSAVTRFEIGPDGSLILHASDGRSIRATRRG